MVRSTHEESTNKSADAIALLKQDHRAVEALFEAFEDADADEQGQLAERVCQLLTVHAQIEEELLYPAAKEALEDEEDAELVDEAEVEHATAKDLIAKIEAMTPDDEPFKATVKVLSEYIKHHVKEEENELFPKLKKTDLDLKDIGSQLAARKSELMEELGIGEGDEAAPRRATVTGAARASQSKSKGKSAPARGKH
jgi:hemerythrin-like domain-containing protein